MVGGDGEGEPEAGPAPRRRPALLTVGRRQRPRGGAVDGGEAAEVSLVGLRDKGIRSQIVCFAGPPIGWG